MENLYPSRAKSLPVLSRRPFRQEVPPVVCRPRLSVRFVLFRVHLDMQWETSSSVQEPIHGCKGNAVLVPRVP